MFKSQPVTITSAERRPDGFALIIALTMMAFVLLLLLSMTTLSRVSTQASANVLAVSHAKQNALMALQVALGELQQLTGPDQRTTARSHALGKNTSGTVTDIPTQPSVLTTDASYDTQMDAWDASLETYWSTRSPGWTGVWASPDSPEDIYTQTPQPVFLGWLVSGAQKADYDVSTGTDFGAVSLNSTAAGRSASDSVTGVTVDVSPNSSDLKIGGQDAVLLVGKETLGSPTSAAEYIAAPLVDINGSNDTTTGRYAYWVGDEGVKARVNLIDRYAVDTSSPTDAAYHFRLSSAQRFAGEAVSGFSNLSTDPNDEQLLQTMDLEHLGLINANIADADQRFQDVTLISQSVLADTLRGGLRRDLSADLEAGTLSGTFLPSSVAPPEGPTWNSLQSFYDLSTGTGAVSVRIGDKNTMSISPLLVRVKLAYEFEADATGAHSLRHKIAFVLANPYSAPLTASSLDFHIAKMNDSDAYRTVFFNIGSETVYRKDFARFWNRFRFRVSNLSIPPGEARVYTMTADVNVPVANPSTSGSEIIPVSEGFDPTTALVMDAPQLPSNTATDYTLSYDDKKEDGSNTLGGANYNFYDLYIGGTNDRLQRIERVAGQPAAGGGVFPTLTGTLPALGGTIDGWVVERSLKTPTDTEAGYAVRAFADYNLRAPILEVTNLHWFASRGFNNNPLTDGTVTANASEYGADMASPRWGSSLSEADGQGKVILYDIPRSGSASNPSIMSLGQLVDADLSASAKIPASTQSSKQLGNAWASPYVKRAESKTDVVWIAPYSYMTYKNSETFYDMSYQLNALFWDSRYFSTIPATGSFAPSESTRLPNGRLQFSTGALPTAAQARDPIEAAAWLMIEGGFNINSSSVEAWRAVLSSLHGLTANGESDLNAPFPRSLHQPLGHTDADDGLKANAWAGFRDLSSDEIDTLAQNIVRQIRTRGPFLSLAHFINRRLIASPYVTAPGGGGNVDDPETIETEQGLRGTLQAAIDASKLNAGIAASSTFNNIDTDDSDDIDFFSKMKGGGYQDWRAATGKAAMGIPGWLSQSDLLQPLGPVIAARSDTFRIRAYGEVLNPVTQEPDGQAWCEAIVQRYPEYIDSSIEPAEAPENLSSDQAKSASQLGRRYQVISLRWLSSDEI